MEQSMLVKYLVKERVCYITMNRPDKRNALSYEMISELKSAFSRAEEDKSVKVIILTGEGKAFCAGADLEYLQQLQNNSYEENLADSNHLKELFLQIYTLKKVVIALVNGHALAGGCGLATVCDFSWSVPEAKFGYTEVKIGFIPAIVKVFLLRKIGEGKAKELLLSGDLITAIKAEHIGLINDIYDASLIQEKLFAFAKNLADTNSGKSMEMTKQMIGTVQSMNVEDAVNYAAGMNAKARATDDCKKGIAAFLNKQELKW
jgi:methylglutaconyl-CoA hydratase